jgi:hypothetical protein
VFAETRYAMNGDVRVAYRTSCEGPPAALFAATHPSRTPALVVLEGYSGTKGLAPEEIRAAVLAHVGHGGDTACDEPRHAVERRDSGSMGATRTPFGEPGEWRLSAVAPA